MGRLTEKRRFESFRVGEETTTICVDGYFEVVENNDDSGRRESHYYLVGEAIDKLSEYEDLEEQGLLLRLPCRCKDCVHWSDMVAGATERVKLCTIGRYMVGANGYCTYGEMKLKGE